MRCLISAIATFFLAAASPAAVEVIHVDIKEMAFLPAKIKAHVGDTVEWSNKDFVAHTATAKGAWNTVIPAGKTGSTVLQKAGSIGYSCTYHPTMKGEIDIAP